MSVSAVEARVRTRQCANCGSEFSYPIGAGNDRKWCGKRCRHAMQARRARERIPTLPKCKNPNCQNRADRIGPGMCSTCYFRIRRNGTWDKQPRKRWKRAGTYVHTKIPTHPMAQSDGVVSEHRAIVYDRHEGICPGCYWCGRALEWRSAVVDHVNAEKDDNRPENLVVACQRCNTTRSSAMRFFAVLSDERIHEVTAHIRECRKNRKTLMLF